MPSTVAIAGITGKFSQCIIRALQESPDVLIRGYCRSPHKLPRAILDSDQIEIIGGSFDDRANIKRFVRGSDVVICCYFGQPEVMTEGQKYLIDACEEENVPRYIPSDFAVDYTKIPHGVLFPKESAKVIMEYLKSRKVKGAHILTGGLMETFWSEFFGIWNPKMCSMSVWGSGEEVWELTTYQTAAAYTAAVALDKSAIGVFRFLGDRKSYKDIQEIFGRVYGVRLRLEYIGSISDLYKNVQEAYNRDNQDVMGWAPNCFAYWCTNGQAYLGDNIDNERYPGIQATGLESFLKGHRLKDLDKADQLIGFTQPE
ncbi:hypothetical protein BDV24DRAFT_170373 [Aspergillus arachidicola]|uniref:NmrA-like domain-containing protein n=1 Tax=Aspergillus arachidicola TaxID=656916 RepID=A0A5N6XN04_9EURO|nr:hypothetical protein BDV24DRAFT_170373 [Aspergillus arachidicola]